MPVHPLSVLIGFICAVMIALAALKAHSLNRQGALAAAILGTVIFGLGGLGWAVLLLAFFISSSILSRLFRKRKAKLDEKFSKGSRRDAGQVAANGAIAGLFVLLHVLWPGALWPWVGFAGALAAANADTWATELGVLSKTEPRRITNGQKVEKGTSGGVSPLGLTAAAAGSLLIALLAVMFWQGHILNLPTDSPEWLSGLFSSPAQAPALGPALAWIVVITLAGLAGSLLDSWIGATVQAIYFCPICCKETERHPLHICGSQTQKVRGWDWMNNDWVNTFCTLAGAGIAVLFAMIFR